jgi:hypothetical protein
MSKTIKMDAKIYLNRLINKNMRKNNQPTSVKSGARPDNQYFLVPSQFSIV